MRNKYFILVLTFVCLLIGESSYSQDWGDFDDDYGWGDSDSDEDFSGPEWDGGVTIINDYHAPEPDYSDLYDPYNYGYQPPPEEDEQHEDPPVQTPSTPPTPPTATVDPEVCTLAVCTKPGYVVDSDKCECVPQPRIWYLDNDGDDYYSNSVYESERPSENYKESIKGYDCDDNDSSKSAGADCGFRIWYLDADGDGYHSDQTEELNCPGTGWVLTTQGVDCDENDPMKTTDCVTPVWYIDNDQDRYYADARQVNESPGDGWIKGETKGKDCDDTVYNKDNICYTPLKDPCLKKVLDAILNADASKNVFTKLFNDNFGTNLNCVITFIEYSNSKNTDVDAFAKQTGPDSFDIRLNMAALGYASDEYVAATIYHEILHNFLTMLYPDASEAEQHEEIERDWREAIADQLKLDFPTLSDQDAKGLAWGGLGDTAAYQKLLADDKKNNTGITGAIAASNKNFKNLNNTNTTTYGTNCN